MTGFIMNPGAGPLAGARRFLAIANMKAFMRDLGVNGARCDFTLYAEDEGRWDFTVKLGRKRVEVSMPGAARAVVRDSHSPWQPRLYVDGSSWYWPYALKIVRDALGVKEE